MNNNHKILNNFERTSLFFLVIFFLVFFFTVGEIIYLLNNDVQPQITKKQQAVSLVKLPDLAIVTEATWLRHRSITNVFTIFPEDGSLLDYYPASFVYKIDFLQNSNNSTSSRKKFSE